MSDKSKVGDERNAGFSVRKAIAEHKPGIAAASHEADPEKGGNHRFPASDPKLIPKETLAERIAKSSKGG